MVLTEGRAYALEHELSMCVARIREAMKFVGEHPTSGGFYACGPTVLANMQRVADRLERVGAQIHGDA